MEKETFINDSDIIYENVFDSEGNPLTKEQVKFFKNSKVRDKKGRLLVCYHGTSSEDKFFDIFDKNRMRQSAWGYGFYFSSEQGEASEYGGFDNDSSRVRSFYLNARKIFRFYEEEDIKVLSKLISSHIIQQKYLDNFEWTYNANIYEYLDWNYDREIDNAIISLGYDAKQPFETMYAVFEPNQIKSITNKNPTNSSNINEEMKKETFDELETMSFSNTKLNQKLFDKDNHLKEDVKESLVKIANTFIEDLQENNIPVNIVDIWLVGSNAAYNYRDDSDIDLHIIANFDETDNNGLLSLVYNYAKSNFNKDHDITVKGMPVEVYIESSNTTSVTNGIYSLLNDGWVKFPSPVNTDKVETEESESIFNEMKEAADRVLTSNSVEEIQNTINDLYITRQASLATDGEYGAGNIAFKKIRAIGLLDKLKEKKRELIDKDLTLEKLNESKKNKQIEITTGDPAKGMAFFNSAMGVSCAENLEEEEYIRVWEDGHCGGIDINKADDSARVVYSKLSIPQDEYDEEKCIDTYSYELPRATLIDVVDSFLTDDERRKMYKAEFEDENLMPEKWIEDNLFTLLKEHGKEIYDELEFDAKLEASDKESYYNLLS